MAAPLFSHTNLPFLLNELTTDRQRCFYLAIDFLRQNRSSRTSFRRVSKPAKGS